MEGKEIIDKIIIGRADPYIYAFTTNTIPNYLKIGDTYRPVPIRLNEWKKYFPDLKEEYKEKAKINSDVFFRDYSVHKYVEEELGKQRLNEEDLSKEIYYSKEFFKNATATDVKDAIKDIKESYYSNNNKYQYYDAKTNLPEIFQFKREEKEWKPRDNQKEAIDNFMEARKRGRKNLLMYAVMRFGKSFTSMMCAKEMNAKLVVIVSAKADVKFEWKKTVEIPKNFEGYSFISAEELSRNNNEISERLAKKEKVVVFLTLQDLQGNLIKEKHKDLFKNKIDLLIVDETHFGARAEKYGKILENTKYEKDIKDKHQKEENTITELNDNLKILDVDITLHLSGTPYRILMGSEFEKEDIISFCQFSDIIEEQEKWNDEHILDDETKEWDNPYFGFPQMVRFAFSPSQKAKEKLKEYQKNGYTYAFSALLKPKSIRKTDDGLHKKFENEQEVLELFETIDGSKIDENVLGFLNYDKIKHGKMCRHIVCVLPYCASCDALEELIKNNKRKFKNLNKYEIINISGVDNPNKYKNILEIKDRIKECEKNDTKTLTLTVNRMLTGSTVEEWDTMIYLKDTSSPQEYDQAIFRIQNQYIKEYIDNSGNIIKYNMKPQTLLVDFDPYRMFILQEQKSKIYNVNTEKTGNSLLEERLKRELKISPIITINKNKIIKIEPKNIMDAISKYSKEKGIMDEANDIPVDLRLLENKEIKNVIDKQAELGSNKGLSMDNTDEKGGKNLDIPEPNFEESDISNEENNNNEKDKDNEKVNYEKKIRTYFARILFYSFLTEDKLISLSQVINSINSNENNKRIAKNLELNINVLKLMNNEMNAFKLSQLDYKIQNINELSQDNSLKPLERAKVAMNKFSKISQSEVITPIEVCKKMYNWIGKAELIKICNNGKILDIASKMGEFTIGLYEILSENNINRKICNNTMYSIPTSGIAYEFTRKIYKILGLNTENIAMLFNSYDLLNIRNNKKIKYGTIKKYLFQNKKFEEIELKDNMYYVKGDKNMKFDLVVGNPPYQRTVREATTGNNKNTVDIFQDFQEIALNIADQTCMIYPAKNYQRGKKDTLNKHLLKLRIYNGSAKNGEKHIPYENSIFGDSVRRIPGDVGLVYYNNNKVTDKINYQDVEIDRTDKILPVIKETLDIAKKLSKYTNSFEFSKIKKACESNFVEKNPKYILGEVEDRNIPSPSGYTKVLTNNKGGSGGEARWYYIQTDKLTHLQENRYKIVISSAYPNESFVNPDKLEILYKDEMFGRTKMCIYDTDNYDKVQKCLRYLQSKFARGISLMTPYKFLYYLPSFNYIYDKVEWNTNDSKLDDQLFDLFNINESEKKSLITFVNN